MFQQEINQYLTTHHYTRIDLKAVLFDMDGVLFDSMKNHATAWHKAMKQYGMSLSKEEAYLHEGRTGAATINIVSQRERGYEADEEEIKRIYQTKSDLKYGLWETIESRTFPGSVSNHHLGTMLGLLMAAYEMNQFKDEYQKAVVENAKHFAKCLKAEGLDVAGDPAIGYTETHQVIVSVGYAAGPEVAARLERNNIIANYQATPDEEGFTASGALRMGVNEMTRFGFGKKEFETLASLIADCVLRGKEVGDEVVKLRSGYTQMHYCFQDDQTLAALEKLAANTGI